MSFDERKYVKTMIENLGQLEWEGLGPAINENYIRAEGTQDKEFTEAINKFKESYDVIYSKLIKIEDDIEDGKYEEYIS